MEKSLIFLIGYGKEKTDYLNTIDLSNSICIIGSDLYNESNGKKDYLNKLILKIKESFKKKNVVYVDDYGLKKNNHYFINNELKTYFDNITIDAKLFLGFSFNKCKSANPTIYDGFDNVDIMSFSGNIVKEVINSPYQGYCFYYKNGNKKNDKKVLEFNGYGNYKTLEPINEKSLFRLASVTKQFIAFGVMDLIHQNKLSLETTLYSLFNDMPEYTKKITIKMLLQHTSGLPDYEDYADKNTQVTDYEILDIVREVPQGLFEPGLKYKYSNTGYVILGLIIEKVSYTRLGLFYQNNIFSRLGMNDSIVNYEGETDIKNRVYGQKIIDNQIVRNDQSYTSAAIGDGGIYSNVNDLKKWIKYLRKNKDVLNELTSDRVKTSDNLYYGYGLRIKEIVINNKKYNVYYHTGSTIGTNTLLGFVDDLDVEFIFLTNQNIVDTSVFVNKFINANFYKNI